MTAAQYFGAGAGAPAGAAAGAGAPPEALHDDLPLPAGAAAPPPALHELFPPAAGAAAPGSAALPPPQAIEAPISIPVTADIAKVFAMFIVFVSSLLLPKSVLGFPATPRRVR